MRKWLALVVPVVLLVTIGSRLVAIQEQAVALREAVVALFEGDEVQAQVVWENVCNERLTGRSEFSCLWLYLSTEGRRGRAPRSSLDPELLATYAYGFGLLAEEARRVDYAIFSYQLSLELAVDRRAADRLTSLLLQKGREGEAITAWNRVASAVSRDDPDYWWAQAEVAILEQDWERSARAYGKIGELALEPYPYSWMNQGGILQRLEDWEGAKEAYRRALAVRPDHYAPYLALGHVYFGREQNHQAASWIAQSFLIKPDYAWSSYYMGRVLHRAGQEEAVDFLAQAIDLEPDEPWHWLVQLGDWMLELGDQEGALAAYRNALLVNPSEDLIQERIQQLSEGGN